MESQMSKNFKSIFVSCLIYIILFVLVYYPNLFNSKTSNTYIVFIIVIPLLSLIILPKLRSRLNPSPIKLILGTINYIILVMYIGFWLLMIMWSGENFSDS